MSNHYDTLGVARTATAKEIRKAYLRRARALHPDRQQGRSPSDARRAEEAMQQVNVAWDTLSDAKKRKAYDDQLNSRGSGGRPTSQPRPATPRRPTPPPQPAASRPAASAARPASSGRSIDDEPGDGSVSAWASLPILILLGIALGVLLVTAFGNNNDGGTDNRPVAPDLDAQMRDEDCFVFVADTIEQVSCNTGRADARVIDIVPDPGNCPANTENITQGDVVLCFQRLIPGSVNAVPSE